LYSFRLCRHESEPRRGRNEQAETINYEEVDAGEALKEMTGGRGPDACIDAVGQKRTA